LYTKIILDHLQQQYLAYEQIDWEFASAFTANFVPQEKWFCTIKKCYS